MGRLASSWRAVGKDDIDLEPDEFSCCLGKLRGVAGRVKFKRNVLTVDPPRAPERLAERLPPLTCLVAGKASLKSEDSDTRNLRLRAAFSRPSKPCQQPG